MDDAPFRQVGEVRPREDGRLVREGEQADAVAKGPFADVERAPRRGERLERGAGERLAADGGQAVGEDGGRERGAAREGAVADDLGAAGAEGAERRAALERPRADDADAVATKKIRFSYKLYSTNHISMLH